MGSLVVMVADESGGDYTGAEVAVAAEHEVSLVEADDTNLIPGTTSGEPWAEVLFINVAPGATNVSVTDSQGNVCAADVPVALSADWYVYLDTVCPSN